MIALISSIELMECDMQITLSRGWCVFENETVPTLRWLVAMVTIMMVVELSAHDVVMLHVWMPCYDACEKAFSV